MRLLVTTMAVMVIAALAPNFALADDHEIARQILTQLEAQKQSGALKNFGVNLQVEDGTVLVRGRTASEQQKKLVLDIARRVDGVQQVVSDLEIKPAAKPAAKPEAAAKPLTSMFNPAAPAAETTPVKTPSPAPKADTTSFKPAQPAPEVVVKQPAKKDFALPPVQLKTLPKTETAAAPKNYAAPVSGSKLVDQKLFAHKPVNTTAAPVKTPKPVATTTPAQPAAGGEFHPAFTAPVHTEPATTAARIPAAAKKDRRQLVAQQPELRETQVRQATHNQPPVRSFDDEPAPVKVATPMPMTKAAPAQPAQPTAEELAKQMPIGARAVLTPNGWVFQAPQDNTPVAFSPAMGANYRAPSHETYRAAAARYQAMQQQRATQQAPIQRVANFQPAPGAPAALPTPPAGGMAPAAGGMPPAGMAPAAAGAPGYHYLPGGGGQPAPQYDHPRMPGYAWPTYASHPNYGAVTYPKQYSPTAWPYIGPFYPYPQVPLGWRKVTLEWDDGWWMLDFKNRR